MANGDVAATAGLAVFAGTQDRRQGYDNDNIRGDEIADHMLNGGHPWSKISSKPATFPPSAHTHDDRYYTKAQVDSIVSDLNVAISALNDKLLSTVIELVVQNLGGESGPNLGMRFEAGHPVLRVGSTEYQIALTSDL